jgi:DUF438 domain-containing protein
VSEIINNSEYRQKVLKQLIMELHDGKSIEEVKAKFEKLIEGVSVSEISQMEQSLIMEGMPVEEVQRLCDVHAAVFKGSIEEIHRPVSPDKVPGHPLNTFTMENEAIADFIEHTIMPHLNNLKNQSDREACEVLIADFKRLSEIDKHYNRKENLLFPQLEKHGIEGPPKVMWGVDDEIRQGIDDVISMLEDYDNDAHKVVEKIEEILHKVDEMIFKEKNILFPMALEGLSEDEWISIYDDTPEIGYTFIDPPADWMPERIDTEEKMASDESVSEGYVKFDTGVLSFGEVEAVLNTLPLDITFIDKDDVVRYFSQGKDRIFQRPKSVIGRTVQNCHPPASVDVVNKIVEDFKTGARDHEDFWIQKGDVYAYIRYFAVRDMDGKYLGTLEVTQDIKPIQQITGEKRLRD